MTADPAQLAAARADVGRYYSDRLGRHGPTPQGVGWTCVPTQELRFVQLARLFDTRQGFSLDDVGCGYGALVGYLRKRHGKTPIDYLGIDVSEPMIASAQRKWKAARGARFAVSAEPGRSVDYCVASGTFNVKLGHDRMAWERLIAQTLDEMYGRSRLGVAVNFLLDDPALDDIPELYRCRPARWIEHGQRLGASVDLREGYGMPEFTLLLRRQ